MSIEDPLLLPETLLWAWRKVRRCYRMADSLYDQAAVAAFELNLEAELANIRTDFEAGHWTMTPLRLVPQPKKPATDGKPRLRQYFEVSVRDQVAWAAIATVLGPELDRRMPAWSYGNRLYRAAWYEQESPEGHSSKLNIGPYRHATGHLYRHFKHSWPLYRRHISLSARTMAAGRVDEEELDEGDRRALHQSDGLAYIDPDYWRVRVEDSDILYAASFDLAKFYPSIGINAVLRGFATHVDGYDENNRLANLLRQMLQFEVDDTGLTEEMRQAVEPLAPPGTFDGIPTGLFVGGFLANVAMLSLDLEVDRLLAESRNIAHFRFVDDHEILSYDFEALVGWIDQYRDLLAKFGIGPVIEPTKYIPPDLKYILHDKLLEEDKIAESKPELLARVSREAEINGRKPTQLMTRTLAQVSLIAATDFDLLTDAGRSQRLEQLEWLLLANIPEQEIRGDTRMAFAAARIATLTPALFRPDEELLMAHRRVAALTEKQRRVQREQRPADLAIEAELTATKEQIKLRDAQEKRDWQKLIRRHFGLLYEAFIAHPDKARLFIRLLDYCRVTGHDGFGQLTAWMKKHQDGDMSLLRCYLGALGLQILSRHVITACVTINRRDMLHRERAAARSFLTHLLAASLDTLVPLPRRTPVQDFQTHAKSAFIAALLLGALELDASELELARALRRRAFDALQEPPTFAALHDATSVSTGIWTHWFFGMTQAYRFDAPAYWPALAEAHDPALLHDWASLRRYPAALPQAAWAELRRNPDRIAQDDEGWLRDATNGASLSLSEGGQPNDAVGGSISLRAWVDKARSFTANDPRRSEWTALEILRQILEPLTDFDGPDMDLLDHVHPDNVLVPASWIEFDSTTRVDDRITWESWRAIARSKKVTVITPGIADYRYSQLGLREKREWERRLRPIGQLLWGILRLSFRLPAAWNIRGQERGLVEAVAHDLERLPISSLSLSLLQSCLMPRTFETAYLSRFPSLFGNARWIADDDTEFDRPIRSPDELCALIQDAQAELRNNQMTVLEHEPRQLIPVKLRQIGAMSDAAEVAGNEQQ